MDFKKTNKARKTNKQKKGKTFDKHKGTSVLFPRDV